MKVITDGEYLKIVEIKNGVKVVAFKFIYDRTLVLRASERYFKKVEEGIYALEIDYSCFGNHYEKDSLFFRNCLGVFYPIKRVLEDKKDWTIRISNCKNLIGKYKDILEFNEQIKKVVEDF